MSPNPTDLDDRRTISFCGTRNRGQTLTAARRRVMKDLSWTKE